MSKKSKEIIFFVVAFVTIFIAPNLLFGYFSLRSTEMFYSHLNEDNEICYQRAKEDSRETEWCNEIFKAARLAYSESRSPSNNQLILLMFQPLLFVLLFSLYNLGKQVKELKEKLDV